MPSPTSTSPSQKLARSQRRVRQLMKVYNRPNLPPEAKEKLRHALDLQRRVVRLRQKAQNG